MHLTVDQQGKARLWICMRCLLTQALSTCTCFAGAEKVFDLGELSDFEKAGLKDLIPELKASIDKGFEFGRSG